MESNKEEALRCLQLGQKYESAGDFARAVKFYSKSVRLYPTAEGKVLLEKIETRSKRTSSRDGFTEEYSQTTTRTTTSTSNEESFTNEQLEMIARIRKCKNYYEILGISQNATESEIKRQYKKLALQLHPDKNRAPGAEECFKKVSQAFSCLSDTEKRRMYDLRGEEQPSRPQMRTYQEIDPEEIFAAFFGTPLHRNRQRGTAFRTYTYSPGSGFTTSGFPQRTPRAHRTQNEETNLFGLIQLLPLLLLLFFGLFAGSSDPEFQFSQSSRYSLQRFTNQHNIPYYVQSAFDRTFNTPNKVKRFEAQVEDAWISARRDQCQREKRTKEQLEARARSYEGTPYGDALKERLRTYRMEACEELKVKKIYVA